MAGFAGSHAVDERRRRRLATASEESTVDAVPLAAPKRNARAKQSLRERGPNQFPLRKLISGRLWKLAAVCLLGYLLAGGILVGGYAAETRGDRLGPGLVRLLGLDESRLVGCYVSGALFLSAQLALLIGWLRSQSMRDFDGRYRGWTVCAIAGFAAAFAVQTGAGLAWSETASWMLRGDFWKKGALAWLVPADLSGLIALKFLAREMRGSRWGQALLWPAALLFAACTGLTLAPDLNVAPIELRIVESAIAMAAAWSLFSSLLFHARHVIYISVEPPADRSWRLIALLRRLQPWAIVRLLQKRGVTRGATAGRTRPRRKKPAARPQKSPRPAAPDAAPSKEEPPAIVDHNPAVTVRAEAQKQMSRRERRMLNRPLPAQQPLRRSA